MDAIGTFLTERWYLVAIAVLLLLFVLVKIAQKLLKWTLVLAVLAVLAALLLHGTRGRDRVVQFGNQVGSRVAAETEQRARRALTDELHDAHWEKNRDGTYTVTTKSLQLRARPKAHTAEVKFMGQTFTMAMDADLRAVVDAARERAGL
jgi:hypothetical protein